MRPILMGVVCIFWCVVVWGGNNKMKEVATLRWGRLFFSAQVRMRHIPDLPLKASIIYQGILRSVGKKPTYWMNDTMQQSLPRGVLRQDNRLLVQQGEKRITLAPGETYSMSEQNVTATLSEEAEE